MKLVSLSLIALLGAGCGDDDEIDSDEEARRAYLGLDGSIEKSLALGFAGFNAASSANISPQMGVDMLGIAFVLLNNVSGHLGLLKQWTPWMVAGAPSLLFLLLSMGAYAWLVRYR